MCDDSFIPIAPSAWFEQNNVLPRGQSANNGQPRKVAPAAVKPRKKLGLSKGDYVRSWAADAEGGGKQMHEFMKAKGRSSGTPWKKLVEECRDHVKKTCVSRIVVVCSARSDCKDTLPCLTDGHSLFWVETGPVWT